MIIEILLFIVGFILLYFFIDWILNKTLDNQKFIDVDRNKKYKDHENK